MTNLTGGERRGAGRPSDRPDHIPIEAWAAFVAQRWRAARRGIPFLLTIDEWWGWWNEDDRWRRRGAGTERLCMARNGDAGPYALGNIYCATSLQNLEDARTNGRCEGRPPKLDDNDRSEIDRMLREGAETVAQIAAKYGISRYTLYSHFPGGRSEAKQRA